MTREKVKRLVRRRVQWTVEAVGARTPRGVDLQPPDRRERSPRRSAFRALVALALAALALAAGGLATGCARNNAARCLTESDCPEGLVCELGRCVEWSYVDAAPSADSDTPIDAAPLPDTGPTPDSEPFCEEAHLSEVVTQELYTVPPNARFMHVKVWGSGANSELPTTCQAPPYNLAHDGGLGGYTEAVFQVTPGETLVIIVGAPGSASHAGTDVVRFGFGSSGGGGLSGVFRGPDFLTENDFDKAYVIAGGGGGAGVGPVDDRCRPGGTGNHPDSGGMSTMMGGIGLDDGVNGGGGGYKGGLGGAVRAAGRGGSGRVGPDAIDSQILYSEVGSGLPPKTDDEDYNGVAGQPELGGLVVIHFVCTAPPVL